MADGFSIDLESLAGFTEAVDRAERQLSGLREVAEGAVLPHGTFTRTAGGQLADAAHAELVSGVTGLIDIASEFLGIVRDAAGATITDYTAIDETAATMLSDLSGQIDQRGGYR